MIVIKQTKHGLKKGQKFYDLKVDGDLAVFRSERRVAFLPVRLLSDIKINYESECKLAM